MKKLIPWIIGAVLGGLLIVYGGRSLFMILLFASWGLGGFLYLSALYYDGLANRFRHHTPDIQLYANTKEDFYRNRAAVFYKKACSFMYFGCLLIIEAAFILRPF